ncbi:hypothetical protein MAP00_006977 [Monascus purpureus]|nr:hypothetical protein MAP00_006977 [Monascus purpureus]
MQSFSKLSTSMTATSTAVKGTTAKAKKGARVQLNQRPIVPFGRNDRILLVGEGDFSFSRSLVVHYRCRNVLATCYDSKEELHSKYPQAERNIQDILGVLSAKGKDDDDDDMTEKPRSEREEKGENVSPQKKEGKGKHPNRHGPNVAFSVDARKLGLPAGGGKKVRIGFIRKTEPTRRPAWRSNGKQENADKHNHHHNNDNNNAKERNKQPPSSTTADGPWDMICFNFPHVGGLSTDVNRQVRANQELLVAFFKACLPLLSSPVESNEGEEGWLSSDSSDSWGDNDDDAGSDSGTGRKRRNVRTVPGQILVTLFEGEPYTLWNIRDLARHAGLRVVTSFRFPWSSYEGYSHARTLGEITGRHSGRGGWKGEDREARTYVFEAKQEGHPDTVNIGKRKRSKDDSDSDSD